MSSRNIVIGGPIISRGGVCEVAVKLSLRTLTNEKCKNTEIECLLIIMIFKCKYLKGQKQAH